MRLTVNLVKPVKAFSPTKIFNNAEPGVWFDPSDLSTLFQDAAGTTPVTAPGQSVGLVLDKSKGLTLGPERVTNGDFSSGTTGWTATGSATLSVVSGRLRVGNSTTVTAGATQLINTVAGRTYLWTYFVDPATSGGAVIRVRDGGTLAVIYTATQTIAGTYSLYFVATASTTQINCINSSSVVGAYHEVDNISVRELPGNHATQATAAARPTYGVEPLGGRRNLLTFTEQFDNAAWPKFQTSISANVATAPDGTTTADKFIPSTVHDRHYTSNESFFDSAAKTASFYLKADGYSRARIQVGAGSATRGFYADVDLSAGTIGAATVADESYTATGSSITPVGNGWFRCTVSGTTPAFIHVAYIVALNNSGVVSFAGDGTSGILIWGAQLETGPTATAYQRVGSAFDVTEAGVPSLHYLLCDGVDDFLVTPTITPGIDKAQVFAGVRKLSDAAFPPLFEMSTAVIANNGSLALFANGDTAKRVLAASIRGTSLYEERASSSVYGSPISLVLSGLYDIAASTADASVSIRANSANVATSVLAGTTQGTGNFLAYPAYIGRRGGTSLPLNGRIYGLIVRFGANLTADQITRTETWVNKKTGAY